MLIWFPLGIHSSIFWDGIKNINMTETAQIINDFIFNDYNMKNDSYTKSFISNLHGIGQFQQPLNFLRMTNDELALMMGAIDTSITFVFSCPWSATFLPCLMHRLATDICVISEHNLQTDCKLSWPNCHWLYPVAVVSGFFLRQVSMNRNKQYYHLSRNCIHIVNNLLPPEFPYSAPYPNAEWSKNPFRSHFPTLYLIKVFNGYITFKIIMWFRVVIAWCLYKRKVN